MPVTMCRLAYAGLSWMVALGLGLGSLACARTPLGATVEDIARARGQSEHGATVFAAECVSCHGQRGEGLAAAPAILGPGALPEYPRASTTAGDPTITDPQLIQIRAQTRPAGAAWRDPFRNAGDLHRFTALHLPKTRAEQLKDPDYWAVVAFMLAAQGATLPSGTLGPASAATPIPQR
jgi:hypothetical protein